jgi:hypothetical protein
MKSRSPSLPRYERSSGARKAHSASRKKAIKPLPIVPFAPSAGYIELMPNLTECKFLHKETIRFTRFEHRNEVMNEEQNLYRKAR